MENNYKNIIENILKFNQEYESRILQSAKDIDEYNFYKKINSFIDNFKRKYESNILNFNIENVL